MPPYCVPDLIVDSERGNESGDLLVSWRRGNDIHQLQHVQERWSYDVGLRSDKTLILGNLTTNEHISDTSAVSVDPRPCMAS